MGECIVGRTVEWLWDKRESISQKIWSINFSRPVVLGSGLCDKILWFLLHRFSAFPSICGEFLNSDFL